MTNETFHELLKKMCGSAGIGCDKCPLNEPKKKAGCTCRKYIEDHGQVVRDIVKGWALERGLLPDKHGGTPETRREILQAAERCVCGDRDSQYGSPENSFRAIASMWNSYLYAKGLIENNSTEWKSIVPQDVAAMMVLFKMARVATGQNKADNWIDGAGYCACGGEIAGKVRE